MGLEDIGNVSAKIVQQNLKVENAEDTLFHQVESSVKEIISDIKEEMEPFVQLLNKDKEEKEAKKTEKKEVKEEIQKQQAVLQKKQIESNKEKFQQASEFLTKGQDRAKGFSPAELGVFASEIQKEKIEKLTKKSTAKLEEKLELLASLEEDFKFIDLNPEDKEVVEQFFDKMARIKNLKARLRQLENVERRYEEEEERRNKEKEKEKKQGQGQNNDQGNKEKKEQNHEDTNSL